MINICIRRCDDAKFVPVQLHSCPTPSQPTSNLTPLPTALHRGLLGPSAVTDKVLCYTPHETHRNELHTHHLVNLSLKCETTNAQLEQSIHFCTLALYWSDGQSQPYVERYISLDSSATRSREVQMLRWRYWAHRCANAPMGPTMLRVIHCLCTEYCNEQSAGDHDLSATITWQSMGFIMLWLADHTAYINSLNT